MDFRKQLYFCGAVLCAVLLDSAVLGRLHCFGVKPNIFLLFIVFFSFYFNFDQLGVLLFCLLCGVLKDCLSAVPFGTYALDYVCVGMVLSFIARIFFRYNWVIVIPLFVIASFAEGIFYVLISALLFDTTEISWVFLWRVSLPECLYGLAVLFIFMKPLKRYVIAQLS